MNKTPFFDKSQHLVQIIAPSSPTFTAEEFELIMQKISHFFAVRSIKFKLNSNINNAVDLPYYANSVEFRTQDLKAALLDENVRIIWALRGGSSSAEVAEHTQDIVPNGPKVLIGFSDVTVLHTLFNQKFNLPSIHGDTINRIVKYNNEIFIDDVIDILNNNKRLDYILKPMNDNLSRKIEGKILGGNLKVLTTLIGTSLHPKLDNCVLIMEDVNEKGYAIMRDLVHMRQAGLFTNLKAIIFGDFTGGNEKDGTNHIEATLNYFALNTNIPCFRIDAFGHDPQNNPIILNAGSVIENNVLKISNPF
jgi:muramoyltetrapeptide carboxypeptidase